MQGSDENSPWDEISQAIYSNPIIMQSLKQPYDSPPSSHHLGEWAKILKGLLSKTDEEFSACTPLSILEHTGNLIILRNPLENPRKNGEKVTFTSGNHYDPQAPAADSTIDEQGISESLAIDSKADMNHYIDTEDKNVHGDNPNAGKFFKPEIQPGSSKRFRNDKIYGTIKTINGAILPPDDEKMKRLLELEDDIDRPRDPKEWLNYLATTNETEIHPQKRINSYRHPVSESIIKSNPNGHSGDGSAPIPPRYTPDEARRLLGADADEPIYQVTPSFDDYIDSLKDPDSTIYLRFKNAFVTNTRLMGVIAIGISWYSTGKKKEFHQYFYIEEHRGIKDYIHAATDDLDDIIMCERSICGGLGGRKVDIDRREAFYLIQIFQKISEEKGTSLGDIEDDYAFILADEVKLTQNEEYILTSKECKEIVSNYELINYFLMAILGKDFFAATQLYTGAVSFDLFPELDDTAILLENNIEYSEDTGLYLTHSLVIDDEERLYEIGCQLTLDGQYVTNIERLSFFQTKQDDDDIEVSQYGLLSMDNIDFDESDLDTVQDLYDSLHDPAKLTFLSDDDSRRMLVSLKPHEDYKSIVYLDTYGLEENDEIDSMEIINFPNISQDSTMMLNNSTETTFINRFGPDYPCHLYHLYREDNSHVDSAHYRYDDDFYGTYYFTGDELLIECKNKENLDLLIEDILSSPYLGKLYYLKGTFIWLPGLTLKLIEDPDGMIKYVYPIIMD